MWVRNTYYYKRLYYVKRLKYVGNDVDVWEMAKIFVKMAYVFDKQLKYVGNDLEIWEMTKIFEKWLRYMGQGFSILETA